ncbi:protein LEO1 homolog [Nymphaea colorata]|nr:protein LEO1 homolog [Nymphaea colorata]
MGGEEKRHQMMQNLFGDQSEEEEEEEEEQEEEEVASDHDENLRRSTHLSDEEGEGEAELEGEGEAETEGQGEADSESGGERAEAYQDQLESEDDRVQSSQERDISGQQVESDGKDAESDQGEYVQRVVTSRRREVIASGSERSEEDHFVENEDEEVEQGVGPRDDNHVQSAAEMRDVFGDSDEDEQEGYETHMDLDHTSHRSPAEYEESDHRDLGPEDMVPEEDEQFGSEEDNFEPKLKEKPVGPPLDLEIPLRPPPALPNKMNMIRVSNIMGIEPKPFDPKTYVEEDVFVTDESGSKKRIRLEDNIVRWRNVRNRDGTLSYESNARFVKWSDGSLQLLIGNEVLDISVQDARHDQTHLFLRHDKGILQSQGRLLRKMRFMPSSLSSKSHRLLTALVDSRHKKVYKVKNCITDIDPEKEKEEKEKALNQTIRSREDLLRKQEKIARKYAQTREKEPQLSPGYLEEALEEEDEADDYPGTRRSAARRFEEELEVEGRAERRILNAKRPAQIPRSVPRKPTMSTAPPPRHRLESSESEREASEYESDDNENDVMPARKHMEEEEFEEEEEDEEEEEQEQEEEEEEAEQAIEEEADEEPRQKSKGSGWNRHRDEESDEEAPQKRVPRRRIIDSSDEEE